jgi:hypothetical protein
MQQLPTFDNGLQLVQAANGIQNRGISQSALLNNLLASEPALQTVFPSANPLADQLKMAARIIGVHSQLGLGGRFSFATWEDSTRIAISSTRTRARRRCCSS